jgi:uncharacterized membrane protein
MIIVGLLLIALAALLFAGFVMAPGTTAEIEFFGLVLPNLSARALLVTGITIGLVAALGAGVIRGELARRRRSRIASRQRARTADREEDPFLLGS